ncbi:MAG TPA: XrtA/PEP-CTERM system histidine kinase PrsK [Sphingomicrobium sp.]|nr:XrtA/PEP-CTERM system histidine kinase PrsK [Sphingomicrobium sp.]
MDALISFWSHALAAVLFLALMIWRLGEASRQPGQRLLVGAFAMTACWAWLSAVAPGETLVGFAESARNLVWISLLYSLSGAGEDRQHGVRLVYGAVAASIGMQLVADGLNWASPSGAIAQTSLILRITTAAGALVLVHNLYGQAAPASRSHIRLAMLGLASLWVYDLNLYTMAYLGASSVRRLDEWRGLAVALTAPFLALGARNESGWRIRLSRAASFQSLSLLAICAYFALMAIVATALRGSGLDWSSTVLVALLALMTVGAMVVIPSARARGWLKVKVAKHLFEHRYDYRSEWLRFTETLGRSGPDSDALPERIVKAFANVVDAPGGLLLVSDGRRGIELAAPWNWPSAAPPADQLDDALDFWNAVEASRRILEFQSLREGWADARDKTVPVPAWMIGDPAVWAGIPLVHHDRLIGIVVLAAPEYRRPLDWEDFDLLRTAGRQAASSLAEAHSQEALANARRFEEFNRRFAFILHDIKNLVSQLSLLARNAERHADNPEFRADMVATLQSSVGKMNDLLARLAPRASAQIQRTDPQPLRSILASAIAANRRDHDVKLLGDSGAWATVDAAALEQALGHILQNAVEASPAAEPVTVRVTAGDSSVSIAVSDKGAGMDGDFIRNQLFQPFASTKSGGFGIGAFEARSLVAAMGGRITVDSRLLAGTTFTIQLPAAMAALEQKRKRA